MPLFWNLGLLPVLTNPQHFLDSAFGHARSIDSRSIALGEPCYRQPTRDGFRV